MFFTIFHFVPYKEFVGVSDGELEFPVKTGAVGPELIAAGPNNWKTLAGG